MSCKRQRMRRREIEKGLITGRLSGAGAWAAGRGPSSWSRSPGGPTAPPGAWGARRAARRWRGWRGCEVAARGAAESARTRCTAAASCSPYAPAPPTRRRSPAPTPAAPQRVHSPDFQSLRSLTCYTGWGTKSHCCSCPTARGSWRWVLGSGTPRERGWRTARSPSVEIAQQAKGILMTCVLLVKQSVRAVEGRGERGASPRLPCSWLPSHCPGSSCWGWGSQLSQVPKDWGHCVARLHLQCD